MLELKFSVNEGSVIPVPAANRNRVEGWIRKESAGLRICPGAECRIVFEAHPCTDVQSIPCFELLLDVPAGVVTKVCCAGYRSIFSIEIHSIGQCTGHRSCQVATIFAVVACVSGRGGAKGTEVVIVVVVETVIKVLGQSGSNERLVRHTDAALQIRRMIIRPERGKAGSIISGSAHAIRGVE